MSSDPKKLLIDLFNAAVAIVHPSQCVPRHLPAPPVGRTIVVGAGKGAAAMAHAVEAHWQTDVEGLVVTRYGHGMPCRAIRVVEAGHPVPDDVGYRSAQEMFELVSGLTANDLVLCLISGGGSALLSLPAAGVSLNEKQDINRQLLRSGAAIGEINCVRKHLSAIKGGQLALRCAPARVATLIISDVPGDDPATVASGPTVPDPTTQQEALATLARYNITTSGDVDAYLSDPQHETPKPGDPRFENVSNTIIASAQGALAAAAELAQASGITPIVLGDDIEGEAREVAGDHAQRVQQILDSQRPRPCAIVSGGETTVTVRGSGRGGRNVEYLLALGLALSNHQPVYALACDTDGIDGTEDNAGAVLSPDSLSRATEAGIDGAELLANNDAYNFFDGLGDLVITGPTLTNVNDFRAIYIP